ncbi:MAG: methyltransferase domain-containing protein [Acidobacteria bacterium]|nr:methyltransferase domain-containing protein [Acidobacteriota bacterium]
MATTAGFHFDEKTAQQLSMLYQTDDVREMQRQYRVWFDPKAGEKILDVGCGTGVNVLALARLVGPSGKVIGIDNSEAMLAIARSRASASNIEYRLEAVEEMAFPENSFDGVVCTQVLNYVTDPIAVIRSLLRVIKPAGRVFIAETDWDTLAYCIPNKELQRKVTLGFSDHHGDGWMARRLHWICQQAGALQMETHPYVLYNTEYSARKYGGPLSIVIRDYLLRAGKCSEAEVQRWLRLLSEAFDNRTYFFSLTRMVYILRKAMG